MKKKYEKPELYTEKIAPEIVKACNCSSPDKDGSLWLAGDACTCTCFGDDVHS